MAMVGCLTSFGGLISMFVFDILLHLLGTLHPVAPLLATGLSVTQPAVDVCLLWQYWTHRCVCIQQGSAEVLSVLCSVIGKQVEIVYIPLLLRDSTAQLSVATTCSRYIEVHLAMRAEGRACADIAFYASNDSHLTTTC